MSLAYISASSAMTAAEVLMWHHSKLGVTGRAAVAPKNGRQSAAGWRRHSKPTLAHFPNSPTFAGRQVQSGKCGAPGCVPLLSEMPRENESFDPLDRRDERRRA